MATEIKRCEELRNLDIEGVVSSMRVPPYEHLVRHVGLDPISRYIADSIRTSKDAAFTLEGRVSGKLVCVAAISHLPFDSDFFKVEMGRIHPLLLSDSVRLPERKRLCVELFSEVISRAKEEQIKQLTLRVSPRDVDAIQAASSLGFKFIDVLVTYAIDMNTVEAKRISPPSDFIVRMKQDSDYDELQRIARDSFTKDRFHSDPNFNLAAADAFHGKWVENSLSGNAADDVIVAEYDGNPVGFTTVKYNKGLSEATNLRSGSMILSAVDSSVRGKGLYTHMIAGGLRYFLDKADVVDLGTQVDNLPVQRAWCGLGFKPAIHMVTMHWWDI